MSGIAAAFERANARSVVTDYVRALTYDMPPTAGQGGARGPSARRPPAIRRKAPAP